MTTNNNIPQFKVWDNDIQDFINSSDDDLLISANNCAYLIRNRSEGEIIKQNNPTISKFELIKIENPVICRFTGIFDKNHTPIYENKKIQIWYDYKQYVGKVIFEKGEFCIDEYRYLRLKSIDKQAILILE